MIKEILYIIYFFYNTNIFNKNKFLIYNAIMINKPKAMIVTMI